jgi:hypothetical protein
MDNLKEEIERIKSLFTEEKLYGNTINEVCDDVDDAKEFLKDKGYSVYNLNKSQSEQKAKCKFPSDKLDCVAKVLRDNGIKYSQFDHEGKCVITVSDSPSGEDRTYMFVNKNNEYAFRKIFNSPKTYKLLDDTETIKYKQLEFRGEFVCDGGSIEVEGAFFSFLKDGSTKWEEVKSNKKKTLSVTLDMTKIQK